MGPQISEVVNRNSEAVAEGSKFSLSWESKESALAEADEHGRDVIVEEQR